ncbi:MAG: hypothetical protein JXR90_11815 [Spirochaetes bacterium]|nr:hypothetical protein [Spirochaetota bacterium]
MKKTLQFVKEFVLSILIITAGSLFIHLAVTIIAGYIKFGVNMITAEQLISIVSASKLAIIISYGILTLLVLHMYKKLKETQDELKREKNRNRQNQQKIEQFREIATYILQNISEPNNTLRAWVERRRASGSVSPCVEEAVNRISSSLDLFSRTFFLASFVPEPVKISPTDGQKRIGL